MRRAKDALRCRNCGERVGAKMNYCGNCGAAITNPMSAGSPPGYGWPQHAETAAAPVDWPLPVVDEANSPLNFDQGIDLEPTIPSLVGPGSLIMPAPVSQAVPQSQASSASPAMPQAAP